VLLRAGILHIEKVAKGAQDHNQGDEVKGPGGCVDELISPQQQLGFNAMEVFTPDE